MDCVGKSDCSKKLKKEYQDPGRYKVEAHSAVSIVAAAAAEGGRA